MKQSIIEIIKKVLTEQPKKKKCDCGCNTCGSAPLLNESKQYSAPISENMRYHLDNKISIHENIFRPGSKSHINLINEARTLWGKGIITLQGEDKKLFENTDLGRFGIYEGEIVPLDLPMMEIENIPGGLAKGMSLEDIAKHHKMDVEDIKKALINGIKTEMEHTTSKDIAKEIAMDHIYEDPKYYYKLKKIEENLEEEKKTPELNKPKRGGSKKFYVYVKDPKTKRIKKISFGMAGGGLRAKLNNPKARQAFSKRHDCPNKKDRTKASYWSCALPRYAKLLGFKTTFSGYW
jgi:hypothetical protein